jgi:hypothetical protein
MNLDGRNRGLENLSNSMNEFVSEGGPALASDDRGVGKRSWKDAIAHLAPHVRARLMAKYSITYNGRHFESGGHRYDLLADAVVYVKLRRSMDRIPEGSALTTEHVEIPDAAQRRLMSKMKITYQDGAYLFGAYRYERLCDAIDYAQLNWRLPV